MSKVLDFSSILDKKEEEARLNSYYNNHDEALDFCEDIFPEGVVIIAIDNGELQLSATIDDTETIQAMLFAALKTAQSHEEDK